MLQPAVRFAILGFQAPGCTPSAMARTPLALLLLLVTLSCGHALGEMPLLWQRQRCFPDVDRAFTPAPPPLPPLQLLQDARTFPAPPLASRTGGAGVWVGCGWRGRAGGRAGRQAQALCGKGRKAPVCLHKQSREGGCSQ